MLNVSTVQPHPSAETGLPFTEAEHAAAGNGSWGRVGIGGNISIRPKVIVDGVSAGESAIDEMDLAVVQDVVAVVVVAGDNSLDVPHFSELGKKARIEASRTRGLPVIAANRLHPGCKRLRKFT